MKITAASVLALGLAWWRYPPPGHAGGAARPGPGCLRQHHSRCRRLRWVAVVPMAVAVRCIIARSAGIRARSAAIASATGRMMIVVRHVAAAYLAAKKPREAGFCLLLCRDQIGRQRYSARQSRRGRRGHAAPPRPAGAQRRGPGDDDGAAVPDAAAIGAAMPTPTATGCVSGMIPANAVVTKLLLQRYFIVSPLSFLTALRHRNKHLSPIARADHCRSRPLSPNLVLPAECDMNAAPLPASCAASKAQHQFETFLKRAARSGSGEGAKCIGGRDS